MKKVLFLTHEPLMDTIAGPSIRVWELAHVLARQQPVTIGTPNRSPVLSDRVEVKTMLDGGLPKLLQEHEIVIAFGYLLRQHPVIARRARYLAMDIYNPFLLENLHMHDDLNMLERIVTHQYDLDVVLDQLERADFFICASERQRDYWLGALSIANRINPYTYQADPKLRKLLDVVPFGVPADPPSPKRHAIRDAVPGIGKDDTVVLWGGGIWNWFDPLTAIRAVASLRDEMPQVKLYFMGLRHPNPENPEMAMAGRAVELADDLGLIGRQVFFHEEWVPYAQRADYLCDADIGISLHNEHIETRLSFRTRLLDYLWSGLPVVSTEGDVVSDELAAQGAGIAVPEGKLEAVVEALRLLARDPQRRAAMRERAGSLATHHTWEQAAQPLLAYCREPWVAADARKPGIIRPRMSRRTVARRVLAVYRQHGVKGVLQKLAKRLKR